MLQKAQPGRTKRDRSKIIASQMFGRSSDRTIDTLKGRLYDMGLTTAPTDKLDLVMLEDFAHLTELVAETGMPWQADVVEVSTVRYIRVRQYWLWPFIAAMALVVLLGGEGQLWDLFPWK